MCHEGQTCAREINVVHCHCSPPPIYVTKIAQLKQSMHPNPNNIRVQDDFWKMKN